MLNAQVLPLVSVIICQQRAPFVTKNDIANNQWFYSDLDEMSHVAGTEPILIDVASGKYIDLNLFFW